MNFQHAMNAAERAEMEKITASRPDALILIHTANGDIVVDGRNIDGLANQLGCAESRVVATINQLEAKGLISRYRKRTH
jgi:DNA-binding MarR family transcriptional regulator